jgi:hypothetical protein
MGVNMYPSSALLGQSKDESIASVPVDELIEKADGFAGVFPGTRIIMHSQSRHGRTCRFLISEHNVAIVVCLVVQSTSTRL